MSIGLRPGYFGGHMIGNAIQSLFGRQSDAPLGAAVSVVLGVYGSQHEPTFEAISTFGFDSMIQMKVWLAVTAGVLAVGQLVGALWMYGKLGIAAPSWIGTGHRAFGFLAILVSLPVAYHCLWSLGFQSADARVLAHSLLGCTVYGAFVAKVVTVRSRDTAAAQAELAIAFCIQAVEEPREVSHVQTVILDRDAADGAMQRALRDRGMI